MRPVRVADSLSKLLTGTAVHDLMKIGDWKTEQVAWYYSRSITTVVPLLGPPSEHAMAPPSSKRESDSDLPLSSVFQEACLSCTW